MLNFLGVGGAFAYELGNCSAYYKKDNELLLIDCGESVFADILMNDLLSDIDIINILITHFHSDHIGSLGSLVFYCDKIGIKKINLLYPNILKLNELVNMFGLSKCDLNITVPQDINSFKILPIEQKHSIMESFGYIINLNDISVYYSGDTKIIPNEILNMFFNNEIDYFYQDVRCSENDYHICIGELNELIPAEYRDKILCMHFNNMDEMHEIASSGYGLVKRLIKRKE